MGRCHSTSASQPFRPGLVSNRRLQKIAMCSHHPRRIPSVFRLSASTPQRYMIDMPQKYHLKGSPGLYLRQLRLRKHSPVTPRQRSLGLHRVSSVNPVCDRHVLGIEHGGIEYNYPKERADYNVYDSRPLCRELYAYSRPASSVGS